MLWSLSILVVALLLIAARFRSRDDGGVSRPLIWLAALLPPLALAATAFLGRGADRERIDVQFVGYRLPLSKLQTCGTPGRNVAAGKGVWIGGGRRWPDDRNPDLISLPGYRGHLAELCTDAKSGGLLVRQVRPGETWYQLPSQAWDLQKSNEIDTQRLVIRGASDGVERGCITYNGASIAVSSIVDFARRERKRAVSAAPMREMRVALRKRFGGWPEDADVACVDIFSGSAAKCAADIVSTKAPLFAWPTERKIAGGWDLVPPERATWNACGGGNAIGLDQTTRLELPQVAPRARLSAWKKSAANVTLRMLTRRTVGGVADQTVPVSADSSDPLPLRLGTAYELGFVQLGQDLVILHEDPSVQLRMTDLYGSPALEVKQGEFDLTFSSPSGEELLVVDLSSRADHLAPKTIFEDVQARVAVPQQGDELSVIAQGRPAEKRKFNEVFALDVSRNASTIRPLLLIRRVGAPAMTFLLPILAALLLIGATLLDRSADPLLPSRWLIAPLLLALLGLRFAMATRWLLNEYGSAEALRNWIVNGAFLLIAPPIVMLVAALLRRAKANVTVSRSTKDLYALPDSTKDAPVRQVRFRQNATQFVARLKERDVVPLLQWTCVAGASMAVWILFAGGERPDVFAAIRKLLPTLVVAALAASLAWGAFRGVAWLADLSRWKHLPLIARALIVGAALFVIRFLTYFIGSQEQLGIIRADVFALPLCAAILAAFTRPGERGRAAWARFLSFGVLFVILFGAVGGAMNDFGLLWVGGMAFVLALPAAMGDRVYAHIASYALFFVIFISPTVAPRPFRDAMRLFFGNRQTIGTVQFNDDLQVSRDRDYYRLIDASQPDAVTAIPSQLAREVVIERERVRYQSLDGAWREPFRSVKSPHSPWTGAGFLRGRAVVGDATFTRAARSDYVFPTYLRAEFGSLGLLAVLALYVALFIFGALGTVDRMRAMPVALWSAAIAAGTGLFMLGGTTRIFPFSGKWPLLMSFASSSDAALALALLMLVIVEKD